MIVKAIIYRSQDRCSRYTLPVHPHPVPPLSILCSHSILGFSLQVELALWDTAGQEDYDRLRPLSYPDSHVVLMCYSIDNPDSLKNIEEKWAPEVRHFCPGVPIVLVGTKSDLRNDKETILELEQNGEVPVSKESGRVVADKMKAVAYMECSAMHNDGVREVFECATRAALRSKKPKHHQRHRCRIF